MCNELAVRGGDRRANDDERVWLKKLLRATPSMYFFEVRRKLKKDYGWKISDRVTGGVDDDKLCALSPTNVILVRPKTRLPAAAPPAVSLGWPP